MSDDGERIEIPGSFEPVVDRLVLVVTGAHLRAEINDRAAAYLVRSALADGLASRGSDLAAVVCTDVWYLNNEDLRSRPTVSIGAPDLNAMSAFLADKLPSALAVDGRLSVQMDLEFVDPVALCWGVDASGTRQASELFVERYSGAFLDRVCG